MHPAFTQHLSVSGMDYAWAAAAGYHRPLGATDSAVDLQHLLREAEGQQGQGQGRRYHAAGGGLGVGSHGVGFGQQQQQQQHGVGGGVDIAEAALGAGMGVGLGPGGGGGEGEGDDPVALLGAGRPLVFLWSLTGLLSLNLQVDGLRKGRAGGRGDGGQGPAPRLAPTSTAGHVAAPQHQPGCRVRWPCLRSVA